MATNSKETKGKKTACLKNFNLAATTWGVLLIMLILTLASVCIYAPVKDAVFKDDVKLYLKSKDFANTLADLTNYLIRKEIANQDIHNHYFENLENIKYYLRDINSGVVAGNMKGKSIPYELNNCQFYLHVITDEEGKPIAESNLKSSSKSIFLEALTRINQEDATDYPANLDITYIVPKKLADNNDLLMENIKKFNIEKYMILILIIGGITVFILSILAFAIPYSAQKQAAIVKAFNNAYLEFKFAIWLAFFVISFIILGLITSYHNYDFNYLNIIYDANWVFYVIGIPVTLVLCTLIYLSIVYVKHIYYTGITEGILKKSLFGKLLIYINNSAAKTIEEIVDAELTKNYYQKLVTLLAFNLLVLIVIAITGGFGIFLALLYTAVLLNYAVKTLNKLRALNAAGSQLAKGDFNITVPEDMGILSPFAKNLNNIKEGFKLAVEEEIKSQNMKTQLISNVSHDLKTPLTSIITYVDLLKNEDLDRETQQEYINILENKSKRLKVLIDDLFEASKASSGNIDLHLEQLDAIALLRQTLGEMEEKINESNLQFRVNLPESKVMCQLDGARTYRIFENIIGNILKYAMPNTRVYIDVVEGEKEVNFIFKNISAYEMNFDPSEIVERSIRGDQSRHTEGSGLGLAIAKSLAELQKGRLNIDIDGDLFKLTVTFLKM